MQKCLIDYACPYEEEGLEDVAKYFAENMYIAFKSFKEAHTLYLPLRLRKKVLPKNQSLIVCGMYKHEQMMDWYDKIAKKIEKV